jgi:membrane associated rhomboid family serine protease
LQDVLQPHIQTINTGYEIFSKPDFLNHLVTVGASGAVYGLLLAFGMIFPNAMIYIYFLFPMKAKWFVILYGVLELFNGIGGSNSGIAHFAHLGGMFFGFFLILYWKNKAKRKVKRMQQQYFYQNY